MKLFPTPTTRDYKDGQSQHKRNGVVQDDTIARCIIENIRGGEILMPTPKALDGVKGNLKSSQERIDAGNQVDLPNVAIDLASDNQQIELFGTVTTATSGRSAKFRGTGTNVVEFAEQVADQLNGGGVLLPTTTANDWKGANHSGSGTASSNGIATIVTGGGIVANHQTEYG